MPHTVSHFVSHTTACVNMLSTLCESHAARGELVSHLWSTWSKERRTYTQSPPQIGTEKVTLSNTEQLQAATTEGSCKQHAMN